MNGRDALDLIKNKPNYYDLVFTDNQMPYLIGTEFAREIRSLQ